MFVSNFQWRGVSLIQKSFLMFPLGQVFVNCFVEYPEIK
jgi:hypothetical protein